MKRILLIVCVFMLMLSGCDKDKAAIFLSSEPITPENYSIDKYRKAFNQEQRINFLLYTPKPLTSNIIRIQVLKLDNNGFASGYSIVHARDIEIDNSLNYVTDYFCLYRQGNFALRIFSRDNYETPIAEASFTVK